MSGYNSMMFERAFETSEAAYLERISEKEKEFPMPKVSILNKPDSDAVKAEKLKQVAFIQSQHGALHNPNLKQSALFHKIMQGEDVNLKNV